MALGHALGDGFENSVSIETMYLCYDFGDSHTAGEFLSVGQGGCRCTVFRFEIPQSCDSGEFIKRPSALVIEHEFIAKRAGRVFDAYIISIVRNLDVGSRRPRYLLQCSRSA